MREENAVDKYIRINPDTRLFEPVWMWRDILPFWLGANTAFQTGSVTLSSSSTPVAVPYKLPHSSLGMDDAVGNPMAINEIVFNETVLGTSTAQFTVLMTDMGDGRQFMNYPIHVRTFAGSGQLAARLAEDLFLPTRHQLNMTFQSIAGSESQSLNLFMVGKLFDAWSSNLQSHPKDRADMIALINKLLERRKYVFPYWMTTDGGVVAVPANGTVDVDTLVGSEGHFEATHILRAFTSGTATTSPFEVELINPETRQSLMNGRIHSYMIGDAFNPQPFPASFVVPAGKYIRFRIKDLSGATNNVYLTLRGRKIRADFKDMAQVKREFGIDTKPVKKVSRQIEMQGVTA